MGRECDGREMSTQRNRKGIWEGQTGAYVLGETQDVGIWG